MKEKEIIKNVIENKRVVSGPDYRDLGAILLFIFLLPYIVSFFFGNAGVGEVEAEEGAQQESVVVEEEIFREDFGEAEYIVCNTTAAGTELIPLETYLISRLPATIVMDYEPEVLKAQAIVLRTELMRNYYENAGRGTADGTNAGEKETGKKYIYVESHLPQVSAKVYEKSRKAVEETKGMYMVYEGVPVNAPYFALSAGKTRNGNEAFHSEDYPYLKSVACERDFTAENYVQTVKVSERAFYETLGEMAGVKTISENWLAEQMGKDLEENLQVSRDGAGYVTEVSVEDAYISGEGIRAAFLLNSSCFQWEEANNTIIIKVKGIGHGLGLCQYGANEAAKKGSDYIDILKYFFTDIVLEKSE